MYTRRQALGILGAGVAWAGGGWSVPTAEAAALPSIPFAYSLYGMRSLPLMRALRVCADIGYSGVELACMEGWPCDPALLSPEDRMRVRNQLQALSLRLPCLMENLRLVVPAEQHRANLERIKLMGQLAYDLAGDGPVPVVETVLGGRPTEWEQVREMMVAALASWAKVAEQSRVVLAVKAHVSNAVHRPDDLLWLLRQVDSPWIKAAFDYSHFERQGLPLAQSLRLLLPQTVFVHIKDNIRTEDGKVEFALPGEGATNYREYMKLLTDGNYSGAVCVEVSSQVFNKPDYDPIVAAERCYLQLRPAFEQAGLRARA